jgi:hypothetical protein
MQIPNKSVPFEYKQFYSNLKNSIITPEQYHEYLKDWEEKECKTRWDCFKYYNINDVKIMHSPINNLIKMFFQYGVDMLVNLSLASLAQCIKYKLLYDDYHPTFPIKYSNIPFHIEKLLLKKKKKKI